MLIVDRMLVSGIKFVLGKIAAAVDAEVNDDTRLREQLLAAQMRLELGEITADEFYVRLQSDPEFPRTSQPTPADFLRSYRELIQYERILSLHLSAKVSGMTDGVEPLRLTCSMRPATCALVAGLNWNSLKTKPATRVFLFGSNSPLSGLPGSSGLGAVSS